MARELFDIVEKSSFNDARNTVHENIDTCGENSYIFKRTTCCDECGAGGISWTQVCTRDNLLFSSTVFAGVHLDDKAKRLVKKLVADMDQKAEVVSKR